MPYVCDVACLSQVYIGKMPEAKHKNKRGITCNVNKQLEKYKRSQYNLLPPGTASRLALNKWNKLIC